MVDHALLRNRQLADRARTATYWRRLHLGSSLDRLTETLAAARERQGGGDFLVFQVMSATTLEQVLRPASVVCPYVRRNAMQGR